MGVGGDLVFFFFKQKTAYEMCGRDWSSDVCSSDLIIAKYLNQSELDVGFLSDDLYKFRKTDRQVDRYDAAVLTLYCRHSLT